MGRKKVPYAGLKPENVKNAEWIAVIEAWENGLSDREAAFRAAKIPGCHIKVSDIKRWMADNPDIADLREYLHSELVSTAKLNIANRMRAGDLGTSKWFLERKAADEFSTKAAVAFEGAVAGISLEDKEKQMQEFMKQFGGGNGE